MPSRWLGNIQWVRHHRPFSVGTKDAWRTDNCIQVDRVMIALGTNTPKRDVVIFHTHWFGDNNWNVFGEIVVGSRFSIYSLSPLFLSSSSHSGTCLVTRGQNFVRGFGEGVFGVDCQRETWLGTPPCRGGAGTQQHGRWMRSLAGGLECVICGRFLWTFFVIEPSFCPTDYNSSRLGVVCRLSPNLNMGLFPNAMS